MELYVQNGEVMFVKLPEEIDHHKAGGLAAEIDEAVIEKSPKELIFDFSKVQFMDSSGIGLLIGRYRNMKCFGGRVYMKGVAGRIEKMIALSGLQKYIGKYEEIK